MASGKKKRRRLGRPRLPRNFDLRKAMFALPNLFTLSSVFCGFYAVLLASGTPTPHDLYRAGLAVFFGIFFDMADGRVARMTRTQSSFGIQLDSLADLVTFGVAPAVIIYRWALEGAGIAGVIVSFVYVACGAIRLARFNVMAAQATGPMKHFIGSPIPLAAGVLVTMVMFHQRTFEAPASHGVHIMLLVLIISYLMISNVRYRTFKDLKLTRRSVTLILVLLALFGVIAVRIRPTFALLAYWWGYLTVGLVEEVIFFRRRRREDRAARATAGAPPSQRMPPEDEQLR
jgi:CDP-diacylglycerol--serine O-phosphatidyltransferase